MFSKIHCVSKIQKFKMFILFQNNKNVQIVKILNKVKHSKKFKIRKHLKGTQKLKVKKNFTYFSKLKEE